MGLIGQSKPIRGWPNLAAARRWHRPCRDGAAILPWSGCGSARGPRRGAESHLHSHRRGRYRSPKSCNALRDRGLRETEARTATARRWDALPHPSRSPGLVGLRRRRWSHRARRAPHRGRYFPRVRVRWLRTRADRTDRLCCRSGARPSRRLAARTESPLARHNGWPDRRDRCGHLRLRAR